MGVQVAVGQGPDLRGASGCWRTAGAARRRSATPRRGWTTSTATARTRRSRWGSSSTTAANRPGCWPGRRRRGRCRPTSPSPSARHRLRGGRATTAPATSSPRRRLDAYAAELGRAPRSTRCRRRARRPALPPLFDFFAGPAERAFQVLGADFVSTEDGTGVVHLAPGSARTTRSPPTPPASRRSCRWTSTAATPPRSRRGRASTCSTPTRTSSATSRSTGVVLRHETYDHSYPHCWRCATAARLPRDLVVVRRGHQVPRPHGRAQRADHLGARAPQGRQLRQVAGERARLVDQPQPLLGLADPGVAQRRPRYPRIDVYGSLAELEADFGVEVDRSPPPAVDELTGPTPTTRPAGR